MLFLAMLVAGCVSVPPEEATGPDERPVLGAFLPPAVAVRCENCREPTVAAHPDGTLFAIVGTPNGMGVSSDGGATWKEADAPPLPPGIIPVLTRSDAILQTDSQGRLYFTAMAWQASDGIGYVFHSGIQVASSGDKGNTWDRNVLYSFPEGSGTAPLGADRPWLTIAPDGTLYLSWLHYAGRVQTPSQGAPLITGVWVARSDDGGLTFGSPVRATTTEGEGSGLSGQPVVDGQGQLVIPYGSYNYPQRVGRVTGEPLGLRLAVSADQGATFESRLAIPEVAIFPSLAVQGDHWALAWWVGEGNARLRLSHDGGTTWSEDINWTLGDRILHAPWLLPAPDGWDVAWMSTNDTHETAHVTRISFDGVVLHDGVAGLAPRPERYITTDFAHAVRMPDGRIATTWSDFDAAVAYVAVHARSAST